MAWAIGGLNQKEERKNISIRNQNVAVDIGENNDFRFITCWDDVV